MIHVLQHTSQYAKYSMEKEGINWMKLHVPAESPVVNPMEQDGKISMKERSYCQCGAQEQEDQGCNDKMNHFVSMGGSTVKDAVRRVPSSVLDHQLALQYNWNGKAVLKENAGVTKHPFGQLALASVVIKAVIKMPTLKASALEVQKKIMIWLRDAADRNCGRKQRRQRSKADADAE